MKHLRINLKIISVNLGPDSHFSIPWLVEGQVNLDDAVRVCSPCPRLYITVVL